MAHRLFDSVECRYLSLLFKRKALPIPVCDSLQCRNTVIGLYTVSSLGMAVYGIYRSPVFSLDLSRSMEKLAVDDGPSLIMQLQLLCMVRRKLSSRHIFYRKHKTAAALLVLVEHFMARHVLLLEAKACFTELYLFLRAEGK